jgi:hypothetical protein
MPPALQCTEDVRDRLLAELGELARLAARRPDLVIRIGEPGCPWSFNWRERVIEVPPDDLSRRPGDFCRGLVLHEAAHAAVTRLQVLVPQTEHRRLHALLNVLEDCRIETWMRCRFPGCVPWVRAYNDLLFGEMRAQPWPVSRCAQFLRGILEDWWFGATADGARPEVTDALAAIRPALADITGAQPASTPASPWQALAVAAPWSAEAEVLAAQRGMWETARTRIVPVWDALAAADQAEGLGPLPEEELARLLRFLRAVLEWVEAREGHPADDPGGGRGDDGSAVAVLREGIRRRRRARTGDELRELPPPGTGIRRRLRAALAPESDDVYLEAYGRVHGLVDRLAGEFIRIFHEEGRSRWKKRQPLGGRLDLRAAMRCEADPRRYRELWDARIAPRRFDPCVGLLVDRSGSMEGKSIQAAFDALVLLVEVCRRSGIEVAVHSFAREHRCDLPFGAVPDPASRRRLAALRSGCGGGTDMAGGLAGAGTALAERPHRHRVLITLGDGNPDDPVRTRARVAALRGEGIVCLGLGLGPETRGLKDFFDHALVEVPVEEVAERLGGLLRRAVLGERGETGSA